MLLRARQLETLAAAAARLNGSSLRAYLDGAESFFGGSGGGLAKLLPGGAGSAHGLLHALLQFRLPEVRYYADERALLGAARAAGESAGGGLFTPRGVNRRGAAAGESVGGRNVREAPGRVGVSAELPVGAVR